MGVLHGKTDARAAIQDLLWVAGYRAAAARGGRRIHRRFRLFSPRIEIDCDW